MRKGQALVIVLLILGIAVTVGLSIMSRSITEVSVSTTSDESARALEAAEAGVEKTLGGVLVGGGGSLPNTSATYQVTNSTIAGSAGTPYAVPYRLTNGDVVTLLLKGKDTAGADITYSGNVRLCWGESGDSSSVEVIVYYYSGTQVRVQRTGYSPSSSYGFSAAGGGCGVSGYTGYAHQSNVNVSSLTGGGSPLFLRMRLIGNTNPQPVVAAPVGNGILPVQGKDVISTGQAGSTNQKLHVVQSNGDVPFMFDMAIFGGADVSQDIF